MLLVVAAALIDLDGRVLISERPAGKTLAGLWEFPGGKIEPDETPEQALKRELREELGIRTSAGCFRPIGFVTHPLDDAGAPAQPADFAAGCDPLKSDPLQLPEDTLLLLFYLCRTWDGTPSGIEGQALRWLKPRELYATPMPPADTPLIAALLEAL